VIRIAVLGAGTMGKTHAAAYAAMADVEVVGPFARDIAGSIEDTSIDAVDVCLPTMLHHGAVMAALAKGKHVFCETPLALRMEEARDMRDAARKTGRLLQVGLLMRSIGAYRHLKAAVDSGEHGRLLGLSTWRLGSYLRPDAPDHRTNYGDPPTELMTFDFDVVNWLMGRPTRISAAGSGHLTALLSYDDHRHATVAASGLMPPGFPFTTGLRCLFERAVFTLETVFAGGPPRSSFTLAADRAAPCPVPTAAHDPYEVELRRFVECIAGRAGPGLLDVERAIEALVLSLATARALADGRPVEIDG
jgi:UDP-N-acetylglucosamine 3-dehydrogenase